MKTKKLLALLLAGAMSLSLLAGCGGGNDAATDDTAANGTDDTSAQTESDLAYVQDKGTMVIGYTVYEPMNYTDENGEFTGFDTEFARAVCEKLGVEPEFVEICMSRPSLGLDWPKRRIFLTEPSSLVAGASSPPHPARAAVAVAAPARAAPFTKPRRVILSLIDIPPLVTWRAFLRRAASSLWEGNCQSHETLTYDLLC